MKKMIKNTLLGCAVGGALLGAAPVISAATIFAPFVVDEGSVSNAKDHMVYADKITGNYTEIISFGSNNTFQVSLLWQAGQFVTNNGSTPVASQLGAFDTKQYGLYALFQGNGTVSSVDGKTTFSFAPGGSLNVYIDPNSNTTFTAPNSGADAYGRKHKGDDYLIAYGVPTSGLGTLDQTLSTCPADGSSGINCGSFGATTSLQLTAAGEQYFIAPNPFYNVSFQSGQLNNFSQSGTQKINGSLDIVFNNAVPEPASITLLGLGFLGLGLNRRRNAKKS